MSYGSANSLPSAPVYGFPVIAPMGEPRYCHYCGARLSPQFYFCTTCATPYQSPDAVVTPAMPQLLTEGQLIAKKAPNVWPIFWTYFGVVLGSGIVSVLLFHENHPEWQFFFGIIALALTTCVVGVLYFPSLWPQLKRLGFFSPWAWACLGILAPMLVANYGYHSFIAWLAHMPHVDPFQSLRDAGLGQTALVTLICVFPAITEEIAFRGLLQHWLQVAIRPWRAVMVAAFLFMAMHFSLLSAPYLFGVGVLLGWAKWKTGSLYPSMVIHFLHNFVVITYFGS